MTATIGSVLPYFGGKRTMAPRIVQMLGGHRAYVEPFAGSLAVLFAKPRSSIEIVNDLNGHLVNLARVLASPDMARELYARCAGTLWCDRLVADAHDRLMQSWCDDKGRLLPEISEQPTGHADAAYWLMVRDWIGRNGASGTKTRGIGVSRRYTNSGGDPGVRWLAATRSIPRWHRRLRGVAIYSMDGIELVQRYEDHERVAIYCDPPYLKAGEVYMHTFTAEQHRDLAGALARFDRATVVVSYYDEPHPEIDLRDLYPPDRWAWHRVDASKALANAGQRAGGAVKAPEVLIARRAGKPLEVAADGRSALFGATP